MSQIGITGLVILATVVLFIWNRLPVVVVAFGTALSLWATGIVTLEQAFAGFGDPAVLFIASLFVVSAALEMTGVTAWVGQELVARWGRRGRHGLLIGLMLLVALLTALISANGAVAALLPVAMVAAVRLNIKPSLILMPLAFSAHAGANLVLTGAPKNVLLSDALVDAGLAGFGYFEFALAGLPLLAGTLVIVLLLGPRLLPDRAGPTVPADFSRHARTLVEQYGLSGNLFRLRLRAASPLIGRTQAQIALPAEGNLQFVALRSGVRDLPLGDKPLAEGDYLLLRGDPGAAATFAAEMHLAFRDDAAESDEALFNARTGLAEIVIPPRSGLIGRTVFPGMVSPSGDLVVLAIQRAGTEPEPGPLTLEVGDALLLKGTWKALDLRLATPDVLMVNSPEIVRRQALPLGPADWKAIAVLGVMVLLLATGAVPPVIAGLGAAGALLLLGTLTTEQAFRSVNWTTVILVGAMIPLSVAMQQTGAAKRLADLLVGIVGDAGPITMLAGLFVLTALLGQIMSNTATSLIVIPVAMAAAEGMGISPRPVMMSLCVAGAASFLTPIATSTNLMVKGPGGYRFGDYWKLGLPLLIWYFVIATFYVPLIWRF